MTEVLTAGPGLDAEVEERVMGRCRECHDLSQRCIQNDPEAKRIVKEECRYGAVAYISDKDDLDEEGDRYWRCGRHDKRMVTTVAPPRSTDISAAWEVLERLRILLPGQEVMLYYCDRWNVGSLCQAPSTIEIGENYGAADTAPLAICLAALKAVDG